MSDFGHVVDDDAADKPVKKMPYFHRQLSAEETAIIGDITPKLVQPTTAAADSAAAGAGAAAGGAGTGDGAVVTPKKLSDTSSWNAAGTWESRNCTKWAREALEPVFAGMEVSTNDYAFECSECDSVDGGAEIVHTRGKVKYIYDLTVVLKFSITQLSTQTSWKGKLTLESVMGPDLEDADLSVSWTGTSPSGATGSSVRKLLLEEDTAVRAALVVYFEKFHSDIQAL